MVIDDDNLGVLGQPAWSKDLDVECQKVQILRRVRIGETGLH